LSPEIKELPLQPAAVGRAVTEPGRLGQVIDRTFPELFEKLAKSGTAPAGPPFVHYLKTGEQLEIELGVPLPDGFDRLEDVECSSLPAGRTAVLRYTGPYDGLRHACEQLRDWVVEQDEEPAGTFWETYVTDPRTEPDPAKRITDIYMPLASPRGA
jgi:effector-binding domain-containing protein